MTSAVGKVVTHWLTAQGLALGDAGHHSGSLLMAQAIELLAYNPYLNLHLPAMQGGFRICLLLLEDIAQVARLNFA